MWTADPGRPHMAYALHFICRGLRIIGLVLLYYVFSIGITFYNKWLMTVSVHESVLVTHSCVLFQVATEDQSI